MKRDGRLYEIDALRLAAALAVMLFHYSFSRDHGQTEADFSALGVITTYGYLGVDLFFVISGFVVFMSAEGRTAAQFVISRVSRLYPAYWVSVSITALVLVLVGVPGLPGVTAVQYLANLTMFSELANIPYIEGVYWTLWAEWRFYALLFVVLLLGLPRRHLRPLLWVWLACSALHGTVPLPPVVNHLLDLVLQPAYSHYFIAGMVLYLRYRYGPDRWNGALLGAAYLHAVYRAVAGAGARADGLHPRPIVVAGVVTAIFAVMALLAIGRLSGRCGPSTAPWGDLTYPLYLLHGTVGYALFNALTPRVDRWVSLVVVIGTVLGLAWAVARTEAATRPMLRRGLTTAWEQVRNPKGVVVDDGVA